MYRRARLDASTPTYECCFQLFRYTDGESHCTECGDQFDWEDLLEAYNPEDYEMDGDDLDDDLAEVYSTWGEPGQMDLWDRASRGQSTWHSEEYEDFGGFDDVTVIRRRARAPTASVESRPNPYLIDLPADL